MKAIYENNWVDVEEVWVEEGEGITDGVEWYDAAIIEEEHHVHGVDSNGRIIGLNGPIDFVLVGDKIVFSPK